MPLPDLPRVLTAPPPYFTTKEASDIAARHYGISTKATLLVAERDQNFRLTDDRGRHYLLKVANSEEDPGVTEFQTLALTYIQQKDPDIPIPRIIKTSDNAVSCRVQNVNGNGNISHAVRLMTWMEGVAMKEVRVSGSLRQSLGSQLARLDLALKDYRHDSDCHYLLWDMQSAHRLHPLLSYIDDPCLRQLATVTLDGFEESILPRLGELRAQVIYNDLNPSNVLVKANCPDDISGIIDFGDILHAPLIIDLAVACAYQLDTDPKQAEDPLAAMMSMVESYQATLPLLPGEIDLLFSLTRMRLVLTTVITNWRASLYPGNRDYILRNLSQAAALLHRVHDYPEDQAKDRIAKVCDARVCDARVCDAQVCDAQVCETHSIQEQIHASDE
jgi:hydroxylysine kinase